MVNLFILIYYYFLDIRRSHGNSWNRKSKWSSIDVWGDYSCTKIHAFDHHGVRHLQRNFISRHQRHSDVERHFNRLGWQREYSEEGKIRATKKCRHCWPSKLRLFTWLELNKMLIVYMTSPIHLIWRHYSTFPEIKFLSSSLVSVFIYSTRLIKLYLLPE